ncbi:unnamed protein product [Zymoseptoria tritici ST99CH_3D7]|uniref:Uncharacterized protein n=1 Tax=Zymoseptoria tritici (strain ST99CH_3D7) TaxID=1276538 RepID=A0A1X7RMM7_ZYMT9|nr:unnamed protein product [Zymoseptoria tritici ST99CH_3D7]
MAKGDEDKRKKDDKSKDDKVDKQLRRSPRKPPPKFPPAKAVQSAIETVKRGYLDARMLTQAFGSVLSSKKQPSRAAATQELMDKFALRKLYVQPNIMSRRNRIEYTKFGYKQATGHKSAYDAYRDRLNMSALSLGSKLPGTRAPTSNNYEIPQRNPQLANQGRSLRSRTATQGWDPTMPRNVLNRSPDLRGLYPELDRFDP